MLKVCQFNKKCRTRTRVVPFGFKCRSHVLRNKNDIRGPSIDSGCKYYVNITSILNYECQIDFFFTRIMYMHNFFSSVYSHDPHSITNLKFHSYKDNVTVIITVKFMPGVKN